MNEYISREAVMSKCDDIWNNADETTQTGVDTINTIDEITDFIESLPIADVQPVNQWISVKDRLPENCIEVLVYDTDCGIVIGWYDKEIGDFAADFISPLDAVTHWQPLPEPPKDGDTNG